MILRSLGDVIAATPIASPGGNLCAAIPALCPKIAPPSIGPGSTSPGLPVGYDPQTGLIDVTNTSGATGVNTYTPVYQNNVLDISGDQLDASGCDLTQQSLLDVSTWCASRWIEVALGGGLLIALLMGGRR